MRIGLTTWEKKYIKELIREKNKEFAYDEKRANECEDAELKKTIWNNLYDITHIEQEYLNILLKEFIIADFWEREVINNYHKKCITEIYEYWYDEGVIGKSIEIINKKIKFHLERIK